MPMPGDQAPVVEGCPSRMPTVEGSPRNEWGGNRRIHALFICLGPMAIAIGGISFKTE